MHQNALSRVGAQGHSRTDGKGKKEGEEMKNGDGNWKRRCR